jgi:hypothetical protein
VEGRQAEYNAALGGRRQDEAVVFNAEARSFGDFAESISILTMLRFKGNR